MQTPVKTNRHNRRKNLKQYGINLNKMAKDKVMKKKLDNNPDGPKELPREMVAALKSGDEKRVEACITKAMKEGWDYPDLIRAFENHRLNILGDIVKHNAEEKMKGDSILLTGA